MPTSRVLIRGSSSVSAGGQPEMCHPEVPAGAPIPDVRIEEVTIPVEGRAAMPGLLAFPERTPAPGILIVNDVFGRSPFYDNLARRLAQAGFVAVTPAYFFREGALPQPTREAAVGRGKKLDLKLRGRARVPHLSRPGPRLSQGLARGLQDGGLRAGLHIVEADARVLPALLRARSSGGAMSCSPARLRPRNVRR